MICPHCNQNVLYKERSGLKCSKCEREFAFEPKTHQLGLHDVRFRKAITKLSDDPNGGDKLYFTSGQMLHFLSRKKLKNSFSTTRGLLVFLSVATFIVVAVAAFVTKFFALLALAVFVGLIFAAVLKVFWKTEGSLSLPQNATDFENNWDRWRWIYGQLPPLLVAARLPSQDPSALKDARGILMCSETEILTCLAANQTAENLGLVLINPYLSTDKFSFIREQRDLPIFVLHDASPEGCLLKDEIVEKFFKNNRDRKIYDLGLRPQTVIKANLMRLRTAPLRDSLQNLNNRLTPEEITWLKNGNHTPLLSLRPAPLIAFVTRAVNRQLHIAAKSAAQKSEKINQNNAQALGFMTWLGK